MADERDAAEQESDESDDREVEGDSGVSDDEGADDEDDDGFGLTDEARSRGGKNSSQEQERDEHGRFVGKD